MALRLASRLVQAPANTAVLGAALLPPLLKAAKWLLTNSPSAPHWPTDAPPPLSVPLRALSVALTDVLAALACSSDAAVAQVVGSSEELVGTLVGLLSLGPLSAGAILSDGQPRASHGCYGPHHYDSEFELHGPDHWLLDLSGLRDGASPERIVPRARLARTLAAVCRAGGPGAAWVVEKAAEPVLQLLALDVQVGPALTQAGSSSSMREEGAEGGGWGGEGGLATTGS